MENGSQYSLAVTLGDLVKCHSILEAFLLRSDWKINFVKSSGFVEMLRSVKKDYVLLTFKTAGLYFY